MLRLPLPGKLAEQDPPVVIVNIPLAAVADE